MGCRLRYRFFFGPNFCPSSSKTFEFSFKNEQGYGRFKAFEPIQSNGVLKMRGSVPVGVEIISATPFVQPEIRLKTGGYYHTDNFVFEESTFRDHRGNLWKMSVDPSSPQLHLNLQLSDDEVQIPDRGIRSPARTDNTKFVQWRAFVLSRSDRKKTLPVIGCPLSAYFSRGLPQKNYNMTTTIPLMKAKSLDGDYSSKEEPSLLVRLEMLNIQDVPGILYDYPTLDFERFQLYHTREGLKRCLKQNESLMDELASLRSKVMELQVSGPQVTAEAKQMADFIPAMPKPISTQHTQSPQHLYEPQQHAIPPKQSHQQQEQYSHPQQHHQPQQYLQQQPEKIQQPIPKQRPSRPTSLHSPSPSPTVVNNPRPAARAGRGPPPKPPPGHTPPISNDSNMKRFAFSKLAPLSATSAAPSQTSSGASTPVNSGPPSHPSALASIAASKGDDTAFKRFSFTGINVTPSLISAQISTRDDQTPGQTQGAISGPPSQAVPKYEVVRRPRSYMGPSAPSVFGPGSVYGPTPFGAKQTSSNTSDSAFKRFSFTGVTTTPSAISSETDEAHNHSREEGFVNGLAMTPEELMGSSQQETPKYGSTNSLPTGHSPSNGIPIEPQPRYAKMPIVQNLHPSPQAPHEYATLEPPSSTGASQKQNEGIYEQVPRKFPLEEKEVLLEFRAAPNIVPTMAGTDLNHGLLSEEAKQASGLLETSL